MPTHRAVDMKGVTWAEGGRRAGYSTGGDFAVEEIASGELLSSDGERPSVWRTKAAAATIAENPPAWPTVEVSRTAA